MNRPAPRKSSLSSASPFDHPTAPEASQEAPAAAPASTAPAPAAKSVTEPLSAAEKGEKPGKPPKITIYQHPDDSARMRGAIVAYMRNVGMTNLSKFANEGLMQVLADELEDTSKARANSINPGATRTSMRAQAYPGENPARNPTPEEIMPVYLYLMGPDSQGVNGQALDAQ